MNKLLVAAVAAFTILPAVAQAATVKSIHSFCAKKNCTDGSQPWGAPVSDGNGNWYGMTIAGGDKGMGTIYRMNVTGGHWTYSRLYSFCVDRNCSDGSQPHGALIADTAGNVYGWTSGGGRKNGGVVFELSPNGDTWTYKTIYQFCSLKDCKDGFNPVAGKLAYQGQSSGVLYDGKSPLFGTTANGGANATGTLFELTVSKGNWTFQILHQFCSEASCADGAQPYSGVIVDANGNLFGSAVAGGAYGKGAIFEMMPKAKGYNYVTLYSFCADASTCVDGSTPVAVPTLDAQGNLIGAAFAGGAGAFGAVGTIWKLVPNGMHSKFTKLYDFCNQQNCADGSSPWASVQIDAEGEIVSTTYVGGDANSGVAFKLTGANLKTFKRLYSWGTPDAPAGAPIGGLEPDGNTFIGANLSGGDMHSGEFYRLTP